MLGQHRRQCTNIKKHQVHVLTCWTVPIIACDIGVILPKTRKEGPTYHFSIKSEYLKVVSYFECYIANYS